MTQSNIASLPKVLISGNWYAQQEGALVGGPINADGTLNFEDAVDIDKSCIDADVRQQVLVAERAFAHGTALVAAIDLVNQELVNRRCRGDGSAMHVEQWECLLDPQRHGEAMEMLVDMEARLFVASDAIAAARAALVAREVREYTPVQRAFIEERILQAVNEVAARVSSGTPFYRGGKVPPKVIHSFAQLHEFCDANCLGGLCDDDITALGNALFPQRSELDTVATQEWMDACNEIQSAVGEWLSAHRFEAADREWTPMTTLATASYDVEFPGFGALGVDLPPGWYDCSFHNDTCPRFERGFYMLYIEEQDPKRREPADAQRFTLQLRGLDGEYLDDLYATDDWLEMRAFIGVLPPSAIHPTHAGRTPARLASAGSKVARLKCTVLSDGSEVWDVVLTDSDEPQLEQVMNCPDKAAAERLLWALCREAMGVAEGEPVRVRQ